MLRRAISNLLSNAIRHATTGSTVRVDITLDHDSHAVIDVTNEGSAIAAEHLPRLFDRFYRVDPARERSSEGAGLGLSITKTIVDAHRGAITACSEAGLTRFRIRLPHAGIGSSTVHSAIMN